MTGGWLLGLVRRRPARVLGVATGVATVVALLATLGGFILTARASMSARATSTVAVDWQVQLAPGADAAAALRTIGAAPGVRTALPVDYGRVPSLTADAGGTTQRTGEARVLGLPAGYRQAFPRQIRLLAGDASGALVAQQTAANLHVVPGDSVRIAVGADTRVVRVSGVVDLPQANSLFQVVGAPPGAQPSAPPDNVLLLSAGQEATVFAGHGDLLTRQVHVQLAHAFAPDPDTAYLQVTRAANNLAAKLAGAGTIGNDLAASLDAARSDAAYANILFLFLGAPGVALAAWLTIGVSGAAAEARRREQALLRVRGAARPLLLRLVIAEALLGGVLGAVAGLAVAAVLGSAVLGVQPGALLSAAGAGWAAISAIVGLLLALAAVALPGLRSSADSVWTATRAAGRPPSTWSRWALLEVAVLAVGVIGVVLTTRDGYKVVLAPEGVATVAVDYGAFVGPAGIWIGGCLLILRIVGALLARPRVAALLARPFAGSMRPLVAAFLRRRARRVAVASALVATAFAFAISTSTFAASYQQQAEVDARLTNGADVRVEVPAATVGTSVAARISGVAGVDRVEPLQHRFAYVGADLQDLFGVHPATISAATSLQNAYFSGGTAAELLARLTANPDGILVSHETALDYGLRLGDRITLRLPSASGGSAVPVRFRYVGQALEFPTAPKDSFLVANADYVASSTRDASVQTYLIASGSPVSVAAQLHAALGPTARVTPIGAVRSTIGSSLTSVDLGGLARVELAFAVLLAVVASGVLLFLGLRERRVSFAVLTALGASRRQVRQVLLAEGVVATATGLVAGAVLGGVIAGVLVAVLNGVFDPPPEAPLVPWAYVLAATAVVVVSTGVAVLLLGRRAHRPAVEELRDQ